MGLINCPECGKEVSDQAQSCPHCGYPLEKNEENVQRGVDAVGKWNPTQQQPKERTRMFNTIHCRFDNFHFILYRNEHRNKRHAGTSREISGLNRKS